MMWIGRWEVAASIAMISSSWHLLLPTALAFNNLYDVHRDVHGRRYLQRVTQEYQYRRLSNQRRTRRHHFDLLQLMQMSESSSTTATTQFTTSATPTTFTFISPTYHVYIEDTDAYGVMYNGNYLRSYERALSHVSRQNHDSYSWMVTSVTNQKFRSSPSLGEEYIIRGVLLEEGEESGGERGEEGCRRRDHEEVWQLEMATRSTKTTGNNGDTGGDDDDANWIVHNSATVTIFNTLQKSSSSSNEKMPEKAASESTPQQQLDEDDGGTIFEQRCTAYNDEFDTHHFFLQNQQQKQSSFAPRSILPIRNAMNFFERSRTNYLGGPDILRKMQVEEDILWVVTSVDDGDLMLLFDEESHFVTDEEYHKNTTPLTNSSRREITVRTNFIVKRRGMIVECRHELFIDDEDDEDVRSDSPTSLSNNSTGGRRSLLAKAKVTVMALKGSTRRPTSKLPNWILDQIMGTSTAN